MPKQINFTYDSPSSIDNAIKEMRSYQSDITYKCKLLAERLANIGVEIARVNVADFDAIYSGELLSSIKAEYNGITPDGASWLVVTDCGWAFYTEFGRSTYRYITTYYNTDREEWSEVEHGSTVDLLFDAYVFGSSEPSLREVYWSNVGSTISALESQSVNPIAHLDWSTEPLTVTVGSTKMIKGLEQALVGCRDQDSVQIYMTYNMAYGKSLVGTVPKNSSVAWYIKILRVTK